MNLMPRVCINRNVCRQVGELWTANQKDYLNWELQIKRK